MNINSHSVIQDKIAAVCQMKHVKYAKATTALSPSLNKVFYNPLQLLQDTAMFLSACTCIRDSSQVSLINKPHNDFFLKHMSPGDFLQDFLHRPVPRASPRAHVHSLGVDQGSTNLLSTASALFLFFFCRWMKTLFMCPSNPGTRYQRDLSLCNKPRSTLKHLLATAPKVQALSCLWCKATSGSHFYQSGALCSATQQNTNTEDLQGKSHLLRLTYYLLILHFFLFFFLAKNLQLHHASLCFYDLMPSYCFPFCI